MASTSPEWSDGTDAASAPSEFLAEFLSAIMRRQYAEALKYCRLILQYEPHNATARGFYPLLQHKLQKRKTSKDESCSSEETSLLRDNKKKEDPREEEEMEQEADESGSESCGSCGRSAASAASARSDGASCASQSSLEPDSSASASLSRRTDPTDRTDRTDRSDRTDPTDRSDPTDGTSAGSAGCWDSSASRSEPDDNGNAPAPVTAVPDLIAPDDVENDNALGAASADEACAARGPHLKAQREPGASLRRLRAQFACSIK